MFLRLLKLQFKKTLMRLPVILGLFGLLVIFAADFCFLGQAVFRSEGSEHSDKIRLLVCAPEGGSTALMLSAIEKTDSAKNSLEIIRTDRDGVISGVESGRADAGIILPESFASHIIKGETATAETVMPEGGSLRSLALRSYLSSGIKDISAVEAAIFALSDCTERALSPREYSEINIAFLNAVFGREDMFLEKEPDGGDALTALKFYAISGLIMLMLLMGGAFSGCLIRYDDPVLAALRQKDIGRRRVFGANFIILLFIYALLMAGAVGILCILPDGLGLTPIFSPDSLAGLGCLLCFCAAFGCLAVFAGGRLSAQITAIFSLVCGLLSGIIIPLSLLPDTIAKISPYMPASMLFRGLVPLYDPNAVCPMAAAGAAALMTALGFVVSGIERRV